MGSASVTVQTIDLSQYVPGFPGVSCGVVIPAPRGPLTATLVTSQAEYLKQYTANNKVEVGYDNSHFSALAYLAAGNKLYVNRAYNTALYGGVIIKSLGSGVANVAIATGLSVATEPTDPPSYTFDATSITADAQETTFTCEADVAGSLNNKFVFLSSYTVDYYAWFNVSAGGTDPEIEGRTAIEVTISTNDIASSVATALASAIGGVTGVFSATPTTIYVAVVNTVNGYCNKPTNGNTGWTAAPLITTQGAISDSSTKDNILIYGINPGVWNNDISVIIKTYISDPDIVLLEDAFIIYVYYLGVLVEQWLCSKLQTLKDKNNNNIYIESILEGSEYIRGMDSDGDTVYPVAQASVLSFLRGSDGSAVADSHMIAALGDFENTDDIYVNIFMDGGWATANYAREITTLCEGRGDCLGILSTPYAYEAASTYMTDIVNYRKYEANINSSFVAMYTPHVLIYDNFNNRDLYVAPDGYVAAVISNTAVNQKPWYAPAGKRRGIINVKDTYRRFDKAQRDIFDAAQINPIRFIPGGGIAIWGQLTLLSSPSALQSINVRELLLVIQPALKTVLEDFEFEFNDDTTRNNITVLFNDYMSDVKANRGVYDYRTVCDTSNNTPIVIDQEKLYADLYIKPTKISKEIYFRTIITSNSVSFA